MPRLGLLAAGSLIALVAACSTLPSRPTVSDIDLSFRPVTGMRLSYRTTTTISIGSEKQRTMETQVIDVVAADTETMSLHVTAEPAASGVVITASRTGRIQRITFDDASIPALTDEQLKAFSELLSNLLRVDAAPRWRMGERRPFATTPTAAGVAHHDLAGSMTLRRIADFDGRLAAETVFDGVSSGRVDGQLQFEMTGRRWTDIQTGTMLRTYTRGTGRGIDVAGKPLRIDLEVDERLDRAASRGL
jgi:hypothetical protein